MGDHVYAPWSKYSLWCLHFLLLLLVSGNSFPVDCAPDTAPVYCGACKCKPVEGKLCFLGLCTECAKPAITVFSSVDRFNQFVAQFLAEQYQATQVVISNALLCSSSYPLSYSTPFVMHAAFPCTSKQSQHSFASPCPRHITGHGANNRSCCQEKGCRKGRQQQASALP